MLDDLTSAQLAEWEAYDRLEPIGDWRADFRMASIISAITNLFRWVWGKKGVQLTSPNDFIPHWGETEEVDSKPQDDDNPNIIWSLSKYGWVKHRRQTVDEMKRIVHSIAKGRKTKQ